MTVDANLVVTERQDALLVPSTAIQKGALWLVLIFLVLAVRMRREAR